ncbi:hypothetical protein COV18_06175 [Candidatus Woesearchaeota archaeon CG10_big_fil_rev_8_21_14_0_10_37_12]|nr:MAG: hypothetical protein COV18_06175 [Candidatus Woesearchaeota archaeon CG10_big_fil_rev_8_21_14_0_10_37_12]
MTKIVLIQGSMNQKSRTALVVNAFARHLQEKQIDFDIIDLRKTNMEFCDGRPLEEYHQDIQDAYAVLETADAVVIGMPVYQTSVSGPLKNFLDITSGAIEQKFFGIVCNSGGTRSYFAAADLMKILSFEVNAMPLQPVVHSCAEDFENGMISNDAVHKRIAKLTENLLKYASLNV